MDEFKVVVTAPGGDTWEWLGGVTAKQAQAVYELLGKPDFVNIIKRDAPSHATSINPL